MFVSGLWIYWRPSWYWLFCCRSFSWAACRLEHIHTFVIIFLHINVVFPVQPFVIWDSLKSPLLTASKPVKFMIHVTCMIQAWLVDLSTPLGIFSYLFFFAAFIRSSCQSSQHREIYSNENIRFFECVLVIWKLQKIHLVLSRLEVYSVKCRDCSNHLRF